MRTEQLPWDSVPGPHYAARELKPRKKWVTVGGWILVAVLLLGGLATRYRVLLVFSALYALALLTKKDVVVTSRGLEINYQRTKTIRRSLPFTSEWTTKPNDCILPVLLQSRF